MKRCVCFFEELGRITLHVEHFLLDLLDVAEDRLCHVPVSQAVSHRRLASWTTFFHDFAIALPVHPMIQ